jgi:hypothetical protein
MEAHPSGSATLTPQNGDWHSLLNALKIYSRFRFEFPYTLQRLTLIKIPTGLSGLALV